MGGIDRKAAAFLLLSVVLLVLHVAASAREKRVAPTAPVVLGKCGAVDGDTLSCLTRERRTVVSKGRIVTRAGKVVTMLVVVRTNLRLNAIDAPELPGHCRKGRKCAPGDPHKAKDLLARLVLNKTVRWVPLGTDRYRRTIAAPVVGRTDLACRLLREKVAIYRRDWDEFGLTRTKCPRFAK